MEIPVIEASEAFSQFKQGSCGVIDVRSENEFQLGSFASAVNVPLLNNDHRHIVGLTYKTLGRTAAIKKGHELVDPIRSELSQMWQESLEPYARGLVFCWRGGLRSKISCQWMTESGLNVARIEGGFKALRRLALQTIHNPPPLLIIGGMTGSGKSKLLSHVQKHVDLEHLARHRGSAFGSLLDFGQPTQINFENALALKLYQESSTLAIEDESRNIGKCRLPAPFYQAMAEAPSIIVEEPVVRRAMNIYCEYIGEPLRQGVASKNELCQHFLDCLKKIEKRLGGLRAQNIAGLIETAFAHEQRQEHHLHWIEALLTDYYDKLYAYSLAQKQRPVLFRGNFAECKEWLMAQEWEK